MLIHTVFDTVIRPPPSRSIFYFLCVTIGPIEPQRDREREIDPPECEFFVYIYKTAAGYAGYEVIFAC